MIDRMKKTQQETVRKMKNNSAGFTLIEMIVTVAIISIFSGVVVTLITTGSGVFRGVSGNTKSQVDAQETLDAIEDMVIDANRSVYYAYGSGTNMGEEISSDIDDSNSAAKTFITCNEYENGDGTSRYVFDVLDWEGSEEKLYYSQREYTKASSSTEEENNSTENEQNSPQSLNENGDVTAFDNGIATFSAGENGGSGIASGSGSNTAKDSKELIARSVFAEGIENFTADVTKVESDRIVRFRLTTENNGKKVKTLHIVNLRNRIQVMKPDDAFASAGSTYVQISIIGAPDSIDAGKSEILAYDVVVSGGISIDPTTVKWEIVDGTDKGNFPDLDLTYGKLSINNDAMGTVTVIVSAKTSDGKQTVTSAPVTIKINNSNTAKIATGIQTATKSLLVAAGYDGLDLNTAVVWNYFYNDSSVGTDAVNVTWTAKQDYGYASVTSAGRVSVEDYAGTENTGSFEVVARDNTYGFQGTITINIARIDLKKPENGATYHVGDKKELQTVYMEGGVENTEIEPTISTVTYPSTSDGEYKEEGVDNFQDIDVGNWKLKASVNLEKKKRGYGTVENTTKFNVAGEAEIIENAEYIVAGNTYACGLYGGYSIFQFKKNWEEDSNNVSRVSLVWSIDGDGGNVSFTDTNENGMGKLLYVNKNATGFMLKATYTEYDREGEILRTVSAEKAINVAYKIEIDGEQLPDTVRISNTYHLGINITIGMVERSDNNRVIHTTRTQYIENNENDKSVDIQWQGDINDQNLKPNSWSVSSDYNKGEKKKAVAIMLKAPGAFMGRCENYLKTDKELTIEEPDVELSIEGESTAYSGDSNQFWLDVTVDGKKEKELDVSWNCNTIGWNATSKSNSKDKVSVIFSGIYTYEISAEVKVCGKTYRTKKNITVIAHTYSMTLKARKDGQDIELSNIRQNEQVELYLEIRRDGELYNDNVKTKWYITNYWSDQKEISSDNNSVQCQFISNGDYKIDVEVTIDQNSMWTAKKLSIKE